MKTMKVLGITWAIVLLSQLPLTILYSSGAQGEEENTFQNEQPFENEQERMTQESEEQSGELLLEVQDQINGGEGELMAEEGVGLSDGVPPELQEQFVEPEGEFMVDEEAGMFDENFQEELEQDMPQQWDTPPAE